MYEKKKEKNLVEIRSMKLKIEITNDYLGTFIA